MERKEWAAGWAFAAGVFCFVVLVGVGGLTGDPAFGWALVSLLCFAAALGICWGHPENIWFTGLLLNVTLWLQSLLALGPAEVWRHAAVLAFPLLSAYVGAVVGGTYPRRHRKRHA